MARSFTILFFLLVIIITTKAQSDTSRMAKKISRADSIDQKINNSIDATQSKINSILNPDLKKLFAKRKQTDSLASDSLKTDTVALRKLQHKDSLKQSLQQKINRLKNLQSGQINLSSPTDSINADGTTQQLQRSRDKLNTLQNKVTQPAKKLEGAVNEKLSLINKEGGAGANLPTTSPNSPIPNVQLPILDTNTQLPKTDLTLDNPLQSQLGDAGQLKNKIGEAKNLPQEQIGKVKAIDEVKGVTDKIGSVNQLTDKAQAYQGDVKNIAQGNLNEVKELPKTLEEQAGKVEELQGLQKEVGQFDKYKQIGEKAKSPEALKEEAIKQATTVAVDHFAGRQEVLQAAVDKMSKLKSKYSSLNSLKDIPKRRPNEMKGKPFIERIVPGITFQIQKSGNVLLDYNPLIGYRLTGRFTAGAGWNERITIGKHAKISLDDRIYGPRVFADFKIGKGFSARTDIEKMNTDVPALSSNGYSTSEEYRAWVWSAFIGLKKEYKFIKNVKGTAQFMYNLYDDHNNSPYADRINVRFGFDFPMKKKVKKRATTSP